MTQTLPNDPTATQPPASGPVQSDQPAQPADASGQQSDAKQFVTKEDLAKAIEMGVRRAQQSARDRTQKIETVVQDIATRLGRLDVPLTPELTEKIRAQAAAELDETQDEDAAPQPESPASDPGAGNPVFDWTMEFYQAEGLDIKPTDPEFAEVRKALDDPQGSMVKYQRVVMKAVDQKRDRLSSEKETADARVLSGGQQSNVLGPDVNPLELFQAAHRK